MTAGALAIWANSMIVSKEASIAAIDRSPGKVQTAGRIIGLGQMVIGSAPVDHHRRSPGRSPRMVL
jgi:hypothetical protein